MSTKMSTKALSWFEKHLNWTVILVTIFLLMLWFLMLLLARLTWDYNLTTGVGLIGGVLYLLGVIVWFTAIGWALRKKRRTLWWLFIIFIPFGFIIILSLDNKSETFDFVDGEVIKRRRD